MSLEQDNKHASWPDSSTVSWDAQSVFVDTDDPVHPALLDDEQDQEDLQASYPSTDSDVEMWNQAPLFSWQTLQRLARQFSPVLVPVPFALLIFLFALPAASRNLPLVPLAIILLGLVVVQGTCLYYAGSNDSLWTLFTIAGYLLFVLVGAYALFGLGGSLFLFVVILIVGAIMGGRAIRQVPEGHADIVLAFGRYERTLFPGLNFVWPWEKIYSRLDTKETTWTTPAIRVSNISRDQDIDIVATITYQLLPEDAHIAALNIKNWEEDLRKHFVGTIKSVVHELAPADFVAWAHHVHSRMSSSMEDITDLSTETRWDRLNAVLRRRLQDQVATRGIQVNLVHVEDITLIPHLAPVGGPPPGAMARPVDMGMARGAVPPPIPVQAQPARQAQMQMPVQAPAPVPIPLPPPDTTAPVPKESMFEALIETYNLVRTGVITDPDTIFDLAGRFRAISNDPEASKNFHYDAVRAANTLYQRASTLRPSMPRHAGNADLVTQPERPVRRIPNDNLMAGG